MYSIWICPDTLRSQKSSIVSYGLQELERLGEVKYRQPDYDLMRLIVIHLGASNEDNELIGFLNTLFDETGLVQARKDAMEEKYHIPMTADITEVMNAMCNLSQGIEARGIKIGEKRGIVIGETRGIEKERLENLRSLMKNLGFSKEQAMSAIGIPSEQQARYAAQI
ncbi:MAG: hypothetical protein IKP40_11160 [Clostridia bacterium]|nr:hypothetical protein [Clostridia bacterium]